MMTPIWLGTSWKMNKRCPRPWPGERWQRGCRRAVTPLFSPSSFFTAIQPVSHFLQTHQLPLLTGAQNMHEADQAPGPGKSRRPCWQKPAPRLLSWDIQNDAPPFNESDAAINRKVHSALGHGLRPLICIGDSAEEKRWQVSRESVRQMKIALYGLSHQQALRTLIAYEPVWAIGEHGTPASPQEAGVIHQALRQALASGLVTRREPVSRCSMAAA